MTPDRDRSSASCRELVVAAVGRWRAAHPEVELQLYWDAGSAPMLADLDGIAQALDNLIANALEHGGRRWRSPAAPSVTGCRITVSDGAPRPIANGSNGDRHRTRAAATASSSSREVAAAHGGRFALSRSRDGTVAALELPLADTASLSIA